MDVSALNFIFGLGIFLSGMHLLESSLAQGAKTGIRKWLFVHTRNPLAAIATGTAVTAFLQSSSLVTLILMAMVGANVLPLANAIGAVLGANLGTTFTGWLVTVLGFKLQLAKMAFPLLGLGGISVVFFERYRLMGMLGGILSGLGLLLLGLDLMKSAVEVLPQILDFKLLAGMPPIVFLMAGLALTAVIQSSSATMMITLTLLHAGLIQLPEAAAFIIGADLGTTSTSALGALRGQPTRKRLAMAHILFNLIADLIAFFVLLPILPWAVKYFPTTDPLMQLVIFHSSFNVVGICLFAPFIQLFTRQVNRLFQEKEVLVTRFIHAVPAGEPDVALIALFKEVEALQRAVWRYCWRAVDGRQHTVRYQRLKTWEGEILQYGTQLTHPLSTDLLAITRDCIYAAKSVSDVVVDWDLSDIADTVPELHQMLGHWQKDFRRQLATFRQNYQSAQRTADEESSLSLHALRQHYRAQTQALHVFATDDRVSEIALSSLLNLNNELLNAALNLCQALFAMMRAKETQVFDHMTSASL